MYCKECGKQIVIDSKFCIYCGTKVDVIETPNLTDDKDVEDNVQQVVVSTLVDSPVKVEIASKEPTIQKSAIANELIANFKMLGIALLLWGGYVLCFMAIHQKDIKPLDDSSWFGESCYDPNTISGNWEMDWRIKYAFSWNSLVTILDTQIYQNLNNLHIPLISNHYRQVATLSSME